MNEYMRKYIPPNMLPGTLELPAFESEWRGLHSMIIL